MSVTAIEAVTFAVKDMKIALAFYQKLGFQLMYGGPDDQFGTLHSGDAYVNLIHHEGYEGKWWGRTVFRVDNVDAHYAHLKSAGFRIDPPRDAPWGERYFHLSDPDGHELSFAEQSPGQT